MNKADELRANYEKALAELQDNCLHENRSDFHAGMDGHAHFICHSIQRCLDCNKQFKRRSCENCRELFMGDGFCTNGIKGYSWGHYFCDQSCADEHRDRGLRLGDKMGIPRITWCYNCEKKFNYEEGSPSKCGQCCSPACAEDRDNKYFKTKRKR